jgi:hypothetical protein
MGRFRKVGVAIEKLCTRVLVVTCCVVSAAVFSPPCTAETPAEAAWSDFGQRSQRHMHS